MKQSLWLKCIVIPGTASTAIHTALTFDTPISQQAAARFNPVDSEHFNNPTGPDNTFNSCPYNRGNWKILWPTAWKSAGLLKTSFKILENMYLHRVTYEESQNGFQTVVWSSLWFPTICVSFPRWLSSKSHTCLAGQEALIKKTTLRTCKKICRSRNQEILNAVPDGWESCVHIRQSSWKCL